MSGCFGMTSVMSAQTIINILTGTDVMSVCLAAAKYIDMKHIR
jgi:hypothetical protein